MSTSEQMSAGAAEMKDAVTSQGKDLASTAASEAGAFAEEVKHQAGSAISNARDQLEQQADAQARRVGSGMKDVRRQLQSVAASTDDGIVSSIAGQLASSLGAIGNRIDDGGVAAIADDVRSFARREPGLFLVGAGALGFFAARLLRHGGSGPPRAARQPSFAGSPAATSSPSSISTPAPEALAAPMGPSDERATVGRS
jgi:hypothetical protein